MKNKILYIDDETINLELFAINFRREYEILTSKSPSEALNILSQEDISVIITDYKMPEMNGMEFISLLKKDKPEVKCIMLSGYLEQEVISTNNNIVFKHVMKPYKKQQLLTVIEEAFDSLQS